MVTPLTLLVAYMVLCFLVGIYGSARRMGFAGTFILSIFLTPVLILILLLITGPSRRITRRARKGTDS
jgi:hypothetical protein